MAETKKKVKRLRSYKTRIWMRPELVKQINSKAEIKGLSRDGAFDAGMTAWVNEGDK